MVVVKLKGGLGNQMFQYAYGRHLALLNNTQLLIDSTFLEYAGPHTGYFVKRNFELGAFKINARILERKELKSIKYKFYKKNFILKILFKNYKIIRQKNRIFTPIDLSHRGNLYVDGYWTSENYFKDIEKIIRKEFALKEKIVVNQKELLKVASDSNSVAVHIRRGDYVADPNAQKHHGVLPIDYYKRAIKLIADKLNDPNFLFFSDDIEWVKNTFTFLPNAYFVEPGVGVMDLKLMSMCKHFIIANSTYSWWGAWLSENKNKIVIAPRQWFADESNYDHQIVPENWLTI